MKNILEADKSSISTAFHATIILYLLVPESTGKFL